jgi:hypothetical protein
MLAVSATSELAARESVSMEDLGDHIVPNGGPGFADYWAEAMLPRFTRQGRPIRRGPDEKVVCRSTRTSPVVLHPSRFHLPADSRRACH